MGKPQPPVPLSQTVDASNLAQTVVRSDSTVDATAPAGAAAAAAAAVPSPSDPAALRAAAAGNPARIGNYALLRAIGEGGMGVVYAAYDEELDRRVAVKIIHPSRQGDDELRTRILREAKALARVSSPNVVHVYQVGEADGQLFIAMEFVNGTTLTKWQADQNHSWQEILRMYTAAGQGLLAAHQAGLVHRDFKPDNVLLGKDGWPRVADFGLARMEAKAGGVGSTNMNSAPFARMTSLPAGQPGSAALTQAGVVMGTPLYMSPEQHLGDPADSRSDQFSFCVALYEALYRQLPFAGNTIESLAFNVVSGRILPRPAGSHVPNAVHEALLRGLSTKPEQRFSSMRELLAALSFDPSMDPAAAPKARRRVVVTMIVVMLLAAVGSPMFGWLGLGASTSSLSNAIAVFIVLSSMAVRFRRVIRKNTFHRGMLAYGIIYAAQVLGVRFVGFRLGLSHQQMVTLDLVTLAGIGGATAAMVLSTLWPIVPLACVSVVMAAMRPEYAQNIASVVLPLACIGSMLQWQRAAGSRSRTRRSEQSSSSARHSGSLDGLT